MPIEVFCDCGREIVAQDELAGKKVRCPQCKQPVDIPELATGKTFPPPPAKTASPESGIRKGVPVKPSPSSAVRKPSVPIKPASKVEDEDEEDIPVVRSKKKKKKGKKDEDDKHLILIGTVIGALIIVPLIVWQLNRQFHFFGGGNNAANLANVAGGGVGGAGGASTGPKPGTMAAAMSSSSVADETLFIPSDSIAVFSFQVSSLMQSPLATALLAAGGESLDSIKAQSGLDLSKMRRAHMVFNTQEIKNLVQSMPQPGAGPGGPGMMPGGPGGPGMMPGAPGGPGMTPGGRRPGGPAGAPGRGQNDQPGRDRFFVSHEMEDEDPKPKDGVMVAQISGGFLPPGGGPGVSPGGFPNQGGPPGNPGGPGGRPGMGGPGMGGPGMMPGGPGMGGPGMMPGGPGMGGPNPNADLVAVIVLMDEAQNWSTPPQGMTKLDSNIANAPGTSFRAGNSTHCHLCPGGKVILFGSPTGLEKLLNLPTGSPNSVVSKTKELLASPDSHMAVVTGKEILTMSGQDPLAQLPPKYAYLKPLVEPMQNLTLVGKSTEDLSLVLTANYPDEAKAKEATAAAKKGAGELNTFQNKAALTAMSAMMGPQGKALGLVSDALGQLKPVQEGIAVKQVVTLKGARVKSLLLPPAAGGAKPAGTPGGVRPGSGGTIAPAPTGIPGAGAPVRNPPANGAAPPPRPGPGGGFVSGASSGTSGGTLQSVRNAAQRGAGQAELKQVGLALLNTESDGQSFPPGAICDPSGKPLLSWRVAILPALEQNNLFRQFHLNEPWDSPHNIELLKYMPKQFGSEANYRTAMRAFVGPGCGMELNRKVRLGDFTDGTSLTAVVAEASEAVEWTKPDELFVAPGSPFPQLGIGSQTTVNVLFADGSVKRVPRNYTPEQWKPLITRNGGERVNLP